MSDFPPSASAPQPDDKERVRGTVLRITFQNEENDYRVIKLMPESEIDPRHLDGRRELVLVGALPGIEVGQVIEAEGRWASHPRHGAQFKAEWFKPQMPSGAKGIEAYLASGVLKGVGKVIAQRIVAEFGEATFDIFDNDIGKLALVKGMSAKKIATIRKAWSEAKGDRELVTFLGDHGISPAWAARLRRAYGDAALSILRANPYRLAADVRGIGFMRADVIARQIGIPVDAPERVDAALAHVLDEASGEGHTFLHEEALAETAVKLLGLDTSLVEERLKLMISQGRLVRETIAGMPAVFLVPLHEAEKECARHLIRLAKATRTPPKVDLEKTLAEFERHARIELAPNQRVAALRSARDGMMVMTGGPGTGKTTTLRAVIELFKAQGRTIRLAAPTGRAARRLSETTKLPAETIHRMLGFQAHTGQFNYDESQPLEADLVVVDEASMLDVELACDLLCALRSGTCLLIVGDEDQLPSVGPGSVLRDLIVSGIIPVVRLNEIFRQAQSSLIVLNAHRVNNGEPPLLQPPANVVDPDFFFIERDEPEQVIEAIRMLVTERIPRKFNLNPLRDIQVLTPMRRGELGVTAINQALQAALNPSKRKAAAGEGETGEEGRMPHEGDRVMQTSNDYEKEVFNGDIGIVTKVDGESGETFVDFDGRAVSYLVDELRQLTLAYAVTIHKSQGSEYPAVVIPMHMQHFIMLRRNLLYTALTRGRRLVCIVGMKKAIWKAVKDSTKLARNSALAFFIHEGAK